MMEFLFGILFFAWIGLSLVWLSTFAQAGRIPWAKRGFRYRRVRWTTAIAATASFILAAVVAQGLPSSGKLPVAESPSAGAREASAAPEASAVPADAATSSTVDTKPEAQNADAEAEPKYTHLKGGYVACVSKELFDQFVHNETIDKNPQASEYLLKNGCVVTRPNVRVSIVESSLFGGWIEFRSYSDEGQPFNAWTNFENVVAGTE